MSSEVLNQLFATFKVSAKIFHNGQYCGNWAIDTSGSRYMTFHVVTHGECYLTFSGSETKQVKLHKGDMIVFPRDSSHCLSNQQQPDVVINQATSQNFANGLQPQATGLVCGYFAHQHPLISDLTAHLPNYILIPFQTQSPSAMTSILQAMFTESLQVDTDNEFILNKLAECALALLLRDHLTSEVGILAALLHNKLSKPIRAIHQSPHLKWKVDELAALANLSRASFIQQFKATMQMPPMEYITRWRLSLAYRLLADQQMTILGVAQHCGYDNESSFSKAFKRVMGISPGTIKSKKVEH